MQSSIEQLLPNDPDWQQLCEALKATTSLTALVLTAWRMGLWLAKNIVEQQLAERAQVSTQYDLELGTGCWTTSKGTIRNKTSKL